MKKFAHLFTFRLPLFMVLLLSCVAIGVVAILRPPRPTPVMILHQPFQMPVPFRNRLAQWIPASPGWAWAWRVEGAVFGKRKKVNLNADFVSLSDSSRATLSSLSLGPPSVSDTNGLQVWLLGADQLKALRQHFKLTSPTYSFSGMGASGLTVMDMRTFPPNPARMTTTDGIEGVLHAETVSSIGSSGLALGCFAQSRLDSTDLIVWITLTELVSNKAGAALGKSPIQTNLAASVRLQVPKGSGFFLVDHTPGGSDRKPIGVIVDLPPDPFSPDPVSSWRFEP